MSYFDKTTPAINTATLMKQFGARITKELTNRYSNSPNWKDGKFQNLAETSMDISFQTLPKLLYKQFCTAQGRMPAKDIPVAPFQQEVFLAPAKSAKLIWYGHSVVLLRINEKTILIDPMFGSDASPIAPFATKRFSKNTLSIIDDLPPVDLLLMTHDHYDHLDMASIRKLKKKTKKYFVGLGVARHLVHWGIDRKAITEFDWWDNQSFADINITYTPTRHFSGRGLTDRAKSLWGGWAFNNGHENIYFSGDGGYGTHFREIGKRLGPFDLGLMECGQYSEHWALIHMFPEESVQAAIDAKVKKGMPVHWSAFALAQHAWTEPVTRFIKAADNNQFHHITPTVGELFSHDEVRQES